MVSISGPEGAEIRYDRDGNDPNYTFNVYSAPFELNYSTTVKAIAVKNGVTSAISSKAFTRTDDEDEPPDGIGGDE